MTQLHYDTLDTPIGEVIAVVNEEALCFCDFHDNPERMDSILRRRYPDYELVAADNPLGVTDRLRAYFGGDLEALGDIPVSLGGTTFQGRVWGALQDIPVGHAISYDQLAANIDQPTAIRAAASANARNPVSIVVPCHRVIGKNGDMRGYRGLRGYGGGIERKAWLLRHEGAILC